MVAVLMCGLALTAIMESLSAGLHVVERCKETSAAIGILDQEMERIHTLTYPNVGLLSGSINKNVTGLNTTFTITYTVATFNLPGDGATYKSSSWVTRVTLTCTWNATFDNRALSRTLTGYFANGGINTL